MALWTFSARLYYERGIFDITTFPTLPPLYYIQLASYSFYALSRVLGIPDTSFLFHTTYAVEALFLKLPGILSDLGVFLLIFRFTNDIRYASLYFLNPFIIFLSSVWGMYDSVMMLPLVLGFVLLERNQRRLAVTSFFISGLVKLFGFVPFCLLAVENLRQKHLRELAIQIGIGGLLAAVVFSPLASGGIADFYTGFVLRFAGLGGAQSRAYNIFAIVSGARFGGSTPYIWILGGLVAALFILRRRGGAPIFHSALQASIVAAIFLSIFSQSGPQWLSWLIPLSILYAYVEGREGVAFFAYFFGVAVTFLIMTLTQGSGWLLTGVPLSFFGGLEGYYNSLVVYAFMIVSMLAMLVGYLFLRPVKFRIEIFVLTALLYAQAYYWFSVIRVV